MDLECPTRQVLWRSVHGLTGPGSSGLAGSGPMDTEDLPDMLTPRSGLVGSHLTGLNHGG